MCTLVFYSVDIISISTSVVECRRKHRTVQCLTDPHLRSLARRFGGAQPRRRRQLRRVDDWWLGHDAQAAVQARVAHVGAGGARQPQRACG